MDPLHKSHRKIRNTLLQNKKKNRCKRKDAGFFIHIQTDTNLAVPLLHYQQRTHHRLLPKTLSLSLSLSHLSICFWQFPQQNSLVTASLASLVNYFPGTSAFKYTTHSTYFPYCLISSLISSLSKKNIS